ncbi:phage regulatory CII family protein [Pelagibacterium montanilacus]|uniref:phage regulatory CII family protein n=1 Tax=Pelagibacterium montanilacus TaxID=2185280 RepID=UPI000F8F1D3A|nr:phage regulatory CII family protein [Pelagibacterium montanilacus]
MKIPLWLKVKAATAESITDAGGNKVCAAAVTRIDRVATFSDYANDAEIKRVIALDTAVELDAFNMRAGRAPRLIALAARELDHFLVPMPRAGKGSALLTRLSAEAMRKVSQVFADLGAALENDGYISLAEDEQLHEAIAEAHAVLAALDEQITADRMAAEAKQGGS